MTHILGADGQRRGWCRRNALACEHLSFLRTRARESSLLRLGTRVVEVLHGDTPHAARLLKAGDDAVASRPLRQEGTRALGIADSGRKADAPGPNARHAREAFDKAERLTTAVTAHERVDLVDDHIAQVAEHTRDCHVLVDQERFE